MTDFMQALMALCKEHSAVIFPRSDGDRLIISVEVNGVWLDFKRIDEGGAHPLWEKA